MRIALVHDWLTGVRGGEKCLDVLCRCYPDAELYTLLHRRGATTPAIERMRIRTSPLQLVPGVSRTYRCLLPFMPAAIESFRLPAQLDLVVSCSHAVAKGVLPPDGVPHVCYCFTPMRYAWHLRDDYFRAPADAPKLHPARLAYRMRDRLLDRLRQWDREASGRVTHFVAISRTVQQRIRECYGRHSVVIPPPVDVDFYTPARVAREDFYLCVSALVPYKRIDLAIKACEKLRRRLVIVGTGPLQRRLARRAGPMTRFLGWRSDAEVRDLLRRSRALIFPGCEDFGIVPVEAQACGCPVIAFARGGATETVIAAGRGVSETGVFFNEQTVDCLCEGLQRLESSSSSFCPRAARREALRYSTQRFRHDLMNYLKRVVEAHASDDDTRPAVRSNRGSGAHVAA